MAIGLVEGGRRKTITALGRSLARALEHNVPEEVSRYWGQIVSGNQFIQKVLASVRIRRGMDAATLQAHVAYSAGQKKSEPVIAGAAAGAGRGRPALQGTALPAAPNQPR